jgi:hypothetical protein
MTDLPMIRATSGGGRPDIPALTGLGSHMGIVKRPAIGIILAALSFLIYASRPREHQACLGERDAMVGNRYQPHAE